MLLRVIFITLVSFNLFGNGQEIGCIREGKGDLDANEMTIVENKYFHEFKISSCVNYCLRRYTYPFILITYGKSWLGLVEKFNCICANEEAFETNTRVPNYMCREHCDDKKQYRCGDRDKDLWSVYCMKKSCQYYGKEDPVCAKRMPHDHHGCIGSNLIDWSYAHNVRNFTAAENDHNACVWECRENHPRSFFSLTRVVGSLLTCSCAYNMAFEPKEMIRPEFCKMITGDNDYYQINCIDDLNENPHGNGDHVIGRICQTTDTVGCVYEDLLAGIDGVEKQHYTVEMGNSKLESINIEICVDGCVSMFTQPLHEYTGVRYDPEKKILSCWCLGNKSFNQSMVGPRVDCSQNCGFKGLTSECGGNRLAPAASIYCSRPRRANEKPDGREI